MRMLIAFVVVMFPFSVNASEFVGPPNPPTQYTVTSFDELPRTFKPKPILDAPFLLVTATQLGTTYWDIDSTFRVLDRCSTCYEANPRMRPYVEEGRGSLNRVQAYYSGGTMLASLGMKAAFRKNRSWFLRNAWVIPQLMLAGVHARAAFGNERIPGDR